MKTTTPKGYRKLEIDEEIKEGDICMPKTYGYVGGYIFAQFTIGQLVHPSGNLNYYRKIKHENTTQNTKRLSKTKGRRKTKSGRLG